MRTRAPKPQRTRLFHSQHQHNNSLRSTKTKRRNRKPVENKVVVGVVVISAATRNPRQSFSRCSRRFFLSPLPLPLFLPLFFFSSLSTPAFCLPTDYVVLAFSLVSSFSLLFWTRLVLFVLAIACSFLFPPSPALQSSLISACDNPAYGWLILDSLPFVFVLVSSSRSIPALFLPTVYFSTLLSSFSSSKSLVL